jgi:cytochrome b
MTSTKGKVRERMAIGHYTSSSTRFPPRRHGMMRAAEHVRNRMQDRMAPAETWNPYPALFSSSLRMRRRVLTSSGRSDLPRCSRRASFIMVW